MEPGILEHTLELAERGGVVVWILLGFSWAALTIVLVKLWQFLRQRIWRRGWIDEAIDALRAGQRESALTRARAEAGVFGRVLAIAIQEHGRSDLPDDGLREEVTRAGDVELAGLEGHLRGLDVIATLAPLLGLLGTVLGMIRAFMQLEQAGSRVDPGMLSGGIWEALLTTAVGLAVAIPTSAALAWLESQVDGVRRRLGDAVTRVLTLPRGGPEPAVRAEPTALPSRRAL